MEAGLDSRWDKLRNWMFRFFHQDIQDLSQEKFTQGFGDGYKKGYEHAQKMVHPPIIEGLTLRSRPYTGIDGLEYQGWTYTRDVGGSRTDEKGTRTIEG